MQTIARRTEEATRELGIHARVMLDNIVATLSERVRDQRGQTAAEYMGILLVVAVIIGAIATSGVGGQDLRLHRRHDRLRQQGRQEGA